MAEDPLTSPRGDFYHQGVITKLFPSNNTGVVRTESGRELTFSYELVILFGEVQSRRFVWELMYSAEEYIDLLNTFSGHIALEPEKRGYLYRKVRELINARPDRSVRRHWLTIVSVARKVRPRPDI